VLAEFERTRSLPQEKPELADHGLAFTGDLPASLFAKARAGRDYIAIQAYVERNEENEKTLRGVRRILRDRTLWEETTVEEEVEATVPLVQAAAQSLA